jgi:uncharacterized protein YjbI with pentapeptide repeats
MTIIRLSQSDVETLAQRQREARAAGLPIPPVPEAWDLTGADLTGAKLRGAVLIEADLSGAVLMGAELIGADLLGADLSTAVIRGADLQGADLRGADLWGADLRGADLQGAVVAEGTIAASDAGHHGGYHWHALLLTDGAVILQYGCDRAPLAEWLTRGPDYGARHGRPPEHWATGPAVAIAAAEALAAGGAP